MKVLATNILSGSIYGTLVDSLHNQYNVYHFEDDRQVANQEKTNIFSGELNDIHFFEECLIEVDVVLFFIEKPVFEDEKLRELLDKIKLTVDIGIQQNKKIIFISDANKELIALTDIQSEEEWRSNNQHSNWVRFQYLVEQEIERAIAEHAEVTIVWHTPIIKETKASLGTKTSSYLLSTHEADLFSVIDQLLTVKEDWESKYVLLGKAFPTSKPIYTLPKKKNWFQSLFFKRVEGEWNIVSESILKSDLVNKTNIIFEKK